MGHTNGFDHQNLSAGQSASACQNGPNCKRESVMKSLKVLLSIIGLILRSCYTVYWEDRQKRKEKRKSEMEKWIENLTESEDDIFNQSEVNQLCSTPRRTH